jgi:hypothetical protein
VSDESKQNAIELSDACLSAQDLPTYSTLRARVAELTAAQPVAVPDGFVMVPTQATMDMQESMRDALVNQGWCCDSASEVDFADLWIIGIDEHLLQQEAMLAAAKPAGGG